MYDFSSDLVLSTSFTFLTPGQPSAAINPYEHTLTRRHPIREGGTELASEHGGLCLGGARGVEAGDEGLCVDFRTGRPSGRGKYGTRERVGKREWGRRLERDSDPRRNKYSGSKVSLGHPRRSQRRRGTSSHTRAGEGPALSNYPCGSYSRDTWGEPLAIARFYHSESTIRMKEKNKKLRKETVQFDGKRNSLPLSWGKDILPLHCRCRMQRQSLRQSAAVKSAAHVEPVSTTGIKPRNCVGM
ncbi:hypothetical protein B0H11DRAFT_1909659 [Mycena galericulata]|nr:hypothetical protein B0H11DRAFT_1909659 [Mycena galericulata]